MKTKSSKTNSKYRKLGNINKYRTLSILAVTTKLHKSSSSCFKLLQSEDLNDDRIYSTTSCNDEEDIPALINFTHVA